VKEENVERRGKDNGAIERRVEELLGRMTVEEKAGQVNQGGFGPWRESMVSPTGLGHLVRQNDDTPAARAVAKANETQKLAREHSRLGIPLMLGADGIVDARVIEAVTFPQQMAMGATWDPSLVRDVYAAIGREMRAVGYARTYTPNLGLARDPRFGRAGECFSEDPWLTARLGVAAVEGLQAGGVMATIKHYAAYDATTGGKDSTAMDVSERTLRDVWLPPFKAAVDAGAGSVMCAYHPVNGVPCAGNRHLLTEILREEWGFDGFLVTDYMCVRSLWDRQHVVESFDDAIRLAFESGVDVYDHDMDGAFTGRMVALVQSGALPEAVLDRAVRRVLRAKLRAGLFDEPFADPTTAARVVGCAEHRAIALRAAVESLVLLKNGGGLLPLKDGLSSIAVIGPNADNPTNQLGVWTKGVPGEPEVATILRAIRDRVSPRTAVRHARGCAIVGELRPLPDGMVTTPEGPGFHAEYFDSPDLSGSPVQARTDPAVEFNWGLGPACPGVTAGRFSVRWTGLLHAPVTGTYRLAVESDYGYRLFIDDVMVVDKWESYVGAHIASLELSEGRECRLRLEYRSAGSCYRIALRADCPEDAGPRIAEAVALARASDVAVVVIGDTPVLNGETHDMADLSLPGAQVELVKAVAATGTPTVVVLVSGRPYAIGPVVQAAGAVVEAWNPGVEGGLAVARVLFGDECPGGRLPVSFPRNAGQVPVYYDQEPGWHGFYACGTPETPLYPFGFGLSYASFAYGAPSLSADTIAADGEVTVSVDVTNMGGRRGDEVVQLYVHDAVSSVVRPMKELKGFSRVTLEPRETRTVDIRLRAEDLACHDQRGKRILEPGAFDVMVGGSSVSLQTVSLRVMDGPSAREGGKE
jgi:beta-glucosidase